jgi:rhamnosyltransferase
MKLARVLAVIVTYNPDIKQFNKVISSIVGSGVDIVIIDNNSKNYSDVKYLGESNGIKIECLGDNYGLAYGQNYAIDKYRVPAHEYILMLDQDSLLSDNAVDQLVENADRLIAEGKTLAAVGPRLIDQTTNYEYPFIQISKALVKKVFKFDKNIAVSILISSGMLINIKALDSIGLMKTEFFIDHIDTEWCFRARTKGYQLYGVPAAVMHHSVGDKSVKVWGKNLPIHSPLRRYYRTRNFVHLIKNADSPLPWKIKELMLAPVKSGIGLVLTEDRSQHFLELVRGLRDGITSNFSRKMHK